VSTVVCVQYCSRMWYKNCKYRNSTYIAIYIYNNIDSFDSILDSFDSIFDSISIRLDTRFDLRFYLSLLTLSYIYCIAIDDFIYIIHNRCVRYSFFLWWDTSLNRQRRRRLRLRWWWRWRWHKKISRFLSFILRYATHTHTNTPTPNNRLIYL